METHHYTDMTSDITYHAKEKLKETAAVKYALIRVQHSNHHHKTNIMMLVLAVKSNNL
jgi:hypothetical protein